MCKTALSLLLVCLSGPLLADVTVYKITDADGHVSYSDHPPAQAGQKIETISLPDVPDDAAVDQARARVEQELAAGRAVTDRMAADRREREAARQAAEDARRQRELQAAQIAALQAHSQPTVIVESGQWWPPYYPRNPGHHPEYPGYPGPYPRVTPAPVSSGTQDPVNRSRPW